MTFPRAGRTAAVVLLGLGAVFLGQTATPTAFAATAGPAVVVQVTQSAAAGPNADLGWQ
ncbi:hypothetical protein [Streptomyces sp. NPDC059906]|uniref:hypothetical protein n=1 Tax=Streptomyces sp. NPDC059906 TaxID=3346997 RepID=UPI00365CDA45